MVKYWFKKIYVAYERYLPLITAGFFLLGIWISNSSELFANTVDNGINLFIDSYSFIAPFAIFFVLTPALIKILNTPRSKNGGRFSSVAVGWFAKQRIFACLFAVIFTSAAFGFPLYINHTSTLGDAFFKGITSFVYTAIHSPYFYALYASVFVTILSRRYSILERYLSKSSDMVEKFGGILVFIIPFAMLAIGSYVVHLNVNIANQVGGGNVTLSFLHNLKLFGIPISVDGTYGLLWVYLAGAFLTAVACGIWHLGLLFYVKYRLGNSFSIAQYFGSYWSRVYPLLWATSSESLAMPLNLNLVQRHYPQIPKAVRQFAVGGGSFLSINGTMICVFVLAGLMIQLLGIQASLLSFLFIVPIVFILGYGVPGIPGELILFGGPILAMLSLTPELGSIFLTLYVGLQIGLPDSFRTGANSTDNCLSALLLTKIYKEDFVTSEKHEELSSDDVLKDAA